MTKGKVTGRAKGGLKRAEVLSPEERRSIAAKAAAARWGEKPPRAIHKGNFKEDFGIDVDCYVLNDTQKTAVISQRGMGEALGYSEGGSRFSTFIKGKGISRYIGRELADKLENPLIFEGQPLGANIAPQKIHGYDVTILIDICNVILKAQVDGQLRDNQSHIASQAQIIVNASAKAGIQGLVWALAGYSPATDAVIAAFKLYVLEEAKKYEPEFPNELYLQWQRLYEISMPERGKPWEFKHLTVRHIYHPLAKSNGRILDLLRALKAKGGERTKKLFQFLNELGARALRMQLGRVLEMCESSNSKHEYEAKIVQRFGGQQELELFMSSVDPTASQPPS